MTTLPLLPVTSVGSWPRPPELMRARRQKLAGALSEAEFEQLTENAVLEVLRAQEQAGVDLVTDGEQRRDNFYSFVADKLDGVKSMTLAEMLEIVEDKAGFEKLLKTLDVPAYSLRNPCCTGKIKRRSPLAGSELAFLKQHTDKAIKIPLPGPYLLTRAMFVEQLTRDTYPTKEALAEDVVCILREEILELIEGGADFIQLDEPVLTEVAFSPQNTRTFMCASLSARGDPTEELEFAVGLINRVLAGFEGVTRGVHICRGNWSRDETILLQGAYHPLVPYLDRLEADQLVLEYATERAGELIDFVGKTIGLGVVNPRQSRVESSEEIVRTVRRALELIEPERLYLNPDCGFGTFSNSPVSSQQTAFAKLSAIARAAEIVRCEL